MQTTITARHCEVSDDLKARAESILTRLGSLVARPVDGTVVFDVESQKPTVEIRLHISRGDVFIASGEDRDHRSALDRAEEKLRRQLEKSTAFERHNRGARESA